MRVFYDHQVTSLQDAGGISRYYFELVRAMLVGAADAEAFRPELLLGLNGSVIPFGTLRAGARVTSMATSLSPGVLRYTLNEALTSIAAPFRGTFDVYHATYQRVLPAVRSRAVVVTHHDSTPDRFPALFADARAIHARLAKVYARADRIVCISESCRQDLLEFFDVPAEKTVVIHHGFTALPVEREGTEEKIPCAQPYLLYVGSRAEYKNFSAVLQALVRLTEKDVHLVAAGGGAWGAHERATIARLGLEGRVHGVSRVSDADLAALYRHAAVFIYPSLYEGFGFPPLEAMSVGCPALVSRSSALPEICGGAAFYFDPADVEELTATLEKMLADDAWRLSKQQIGLEQIRRYSWETAAARTLATYRSALGR